MNAERTFRWLSFMTTANVRVGAAIRPMLPNKPRGVPRVNDRHVLNGIFGVLRQVTDLRQGP